MIATTADEIKSLRSAGKILAGVLDDLIKIAKPGVSTAELDLAAEHAKILDHEFQKAHSDAPATFRTWLRRAAELRSVHSANGRSVAPGLEEYNLTKQRQGEEFAQRQLARMRRQQ